MGNKFRLLLLVLTTACLSMMMANMLTFNFCVICMTEEKFAFRDYTIDVGPDWAKKIESDLFSKRPPEDVANIANKSLSAADLQSFNGWNATFLKDLYPEVILEIKKYVIDRVNVRQQFIDVEGGNMSDWKTLKPEDIELKKLTWEGLIYTRCRIWLKKADHYYTSKERSVLFSAVAFGALLLIYPVITGIHKFGLRKSFTVVGTISAAATALCPLFAYYGVASFTIARMVQGIGFAACMPVIGSVTSTWAGVSENGLFNGLLTSFIQLGPVITMPMAGYLCESSAGWQSVFYAHSAITAILTLLFWLLYRDLPSGCRCVSARELQFIQEGKSTDEKRNLKREKVPLREIYKSTSAWAVWIAATGNMYSIQMVVMFAPTFISQILHFPIVNTGFAAALPTFLQFVVKVIAGCCSDAIKSIGETTKVRLFNSIAFVGMAVFLIALAITPASHTSVSLFFLVSCATVLGFNTGGFFKSSTLIARQYSHFVNANVQVIMCFAMLTVPFVVYSLTPRGLHSEWRWVFLLHAALLLLTNTVFCVIGEGVPAAFTSPSNKEESGPSKGGRKSAIDLSLMYDSSESH